MPACQYPQVRNWSTGRCRTPCKNHQAINPDTGRCVTKTYLKAKHYEGDLTDYEYRSALQDDGITRRHSSRRPSSSRSYVDRAVDRLGDFDYSDFEYKQRKPRSYGSRYYGRSRYGDNRSDLRDLLVADDHCYPRKLNLLTGRCKTPCEPWEAINPATGRCVTKEYLESLDWDLYDSDEEDDMAENIKWSPSTYQTRERHSSNGVLTSLIDASHLNVADLRTLRGLQQVSQNNLNGPPVIVVGHYSPSQRKWCDKSSIMSVLHSDAEKCGFKNAEVIDDAPSDKLENMMKSSGKNFTFVSGLSLNHEVLAEAVATATGKSIKFALIDARGVWRILVAKTDVKRETNELEAELRPLFSKDGQNRKKLASKLDKHFEDKVSISYHEFDDQTKL